LIINISLSINSFGERIQGSLTCFRIMKLGDSEKELEIFFINSRVLHKFFYKLKNDRIERTIGTINDDDS